MQTLIPLWTHGLAAVVFTALLLWRVRGEARRKDDRILLSGLALTGCWAWLSAIDANATLVAFSETIRNLAWIALLYRLSDAGDERQHGVRLVYGAVGAGLGLQFVFDGLAASSGSHVGLETGWLLRITAAAGALVLVHNLYGQAAPASRSSIRFAMLGLALIWAYDLNLYTVAYLHAGAASGLADWRGMAVALAGPLFILGGEREQGWRIRLSRAATFQSLSLLAICGYFAIMTILAAALRGTDWDWSGAILIGLLVVMTIAALVLLPSSLARGWVRIKLTKHLFEHRYDYRAEWLRFTSTLGRSGSDDPPLGERVIKAFADIVDAPGGMLLELGSARSIAVSAAWNWPGQNPPPGKPRSDSGFWSEVESKARILELDPYRKRWGDPKDLAVPVPQWVVDDAAAWAGVPLIHHDRLIGIVLLAGPDVRRSLDWEDFDLLRTAGRQAASSLAEAQGQAALANAQRFEEFNRRFAFILHDIKNLVSQLSLLARNAERHADNVEFRGDMVATLKSSVGKMNDLLTRLSPQAVQRVQRAFPTSLRPILVAAIAAKRREHDVRLLGPAGGDVLADAPGLEQAVGHLLQNAIEASPGDQPVIVRVAESGSGPTISISDRGCGMDGEFVRDRLFQPFVSTKAGGFGVGAFEARSLILAMGGELTVSSRPGIGTTFTIQLAAVEAADAIIRKSA